MPDQSSAATEHALIQEITAPLATLPDDPLPVVADIDFPIALRGYDRLAVDAYVTKTSQLVAELQATRSPEAAIRRALERVGEEVAGILQRAHETAEDITMQSRSEAEDRIEAARREAAALSATAERSVRELDADTDRIWAERHRIVEDARELASQLLALANSAAERFPPAEETAVQTPAATAAAAGAEAEVRAPEEQAPGAPAAEELGPEELVPEELVPEELGPEEAAPEEPAPEEPAPEGPQAQDPDSEQLAYEGRAGEDPLPAEAPLPEPHDAPPAEETDPEELSGDSARVPLRPFDHAAMEEPIGESPSEEGLADSEIEETIALPGVQRLEDRRPQP